MNWQNKLPLIAILRGITPGEVLSHVEALLHAGFEAIEVPTNSPDWQQSIALLNQNFAQDALIGAGTVLQPAMVDQLAEVGGKLVVTPNISPAVIRRARERDMMVCAGFMTATEAFTALDAGAQSLKLFPSSSLGPDYIKALKAVIPASVTLFAVGGVTPQNLSDYLHAGCTGAGLGSDLYRAGQGPERTAQQAKAFINAFREYHAK
ncbi:MAG: 2-dehydro-3-deoxy-6-phosphogalactonate aldolase [Enterobacteriaceae bacterium]